MHIDSSENFYDNETTVEQDSPAWKSTYILSSTRIKLLKHSNNSGTCIEGLQLSGRMNYQCAFKVSHRSVISVPICRN